MRESGGGDMSKIIMGLAATAILTAAVLVALAACGGSGASSLSSAEMVLLRSREPVRIGAILSFSGSSYLGDSLYRSVAMAAADFGSVSGRGGSARRAVLVEPPIDSGCSADGGRAAALQTTVNLDVIGVVGTTCSAAAVTASPVLSEAGVPMIAPSNTSPALTSDLMGNPGADYHPGYFRVSNNDLYQAEAVARFAHGDLGLRRMAALHDGDPYTSGLAAAFADSFESLGGVVAATERIEKGDRDMSAALSRFADVAPDGVFLPIFTPEGAAFMRQARTVEALSDAVFIGGGALLAADFLAVPETVGMYIAGPEATYTGRNSATGKSASEVLAAYEAMYGEPPASPYWGLAYDAAALLLAGAQRAARTEINGIPWMGGVERLLIVRSELREGIAAASADMTGLSGRIRCDEFGDCGSGRLNIYHHADAAVSDPALIQVAHRYEYEGK